MYAIKTADIVLFGGYNQLNVTHTQKATIRTSIKPTTNGKHNNKNNKQFDGKESVWRIR